MSDKIKEHFRTRPQREAVIYALSYISGFITGCGNNRAKDYLKTLMEIDELVKCVQECVQHGVE